MLTPSTHLVALSDATVDPAATPTVTPDAVLFAHSVLVLLRSVRTDRSAEDTYVVLPDLKNELVEVATRRGWDAPDELAAKVSYQPVGHKIVHIDRRARGGARLRLVGL